MFTKVSTFQSLAPETQKQGILLNPVLCDITVFKAKIRKEMYAAYVAEEMAKLTAGIFV